MIREEKQTCMTGVIYRYASQKKKNKKEEERIRINKIMLNQISLPQIV